MDTPLVIAQLNLGDWVEDAVILAIIVISALSGVGKMIAKKLNAKREADQEGIPRGPQQQPDSVRGRTLKAPPAARPAPPRARTQTASQRPAARPLPARPVPPRSTASPPPRWAEPIIELRPEPSEGVPIPAAPRMPAVTSDRPRRESVREHHLEVSVQPKARRERAVIEKREEQRSRLIEQRLGHVDEGLVLPELEDHYGARQPLARHFSIQTMRQAVVLSEILAPPVSMRPPDPRRD